MHPYRCVFVWCFACATHKRTQRSLRAHCSGHFYDCVLYYKCECLKIKFPNDQRARAASCELPVPRYKKAKAPFTVYHILILQHTKRKTEKDSKGRKRRGRVEKNREREEESHCAHERMYTSHMHNGQMQAGRVARVQ